MAVHDLCLLLITPSMVTRFLIGSCRIAPIGPLYHKPVSSAIFIWPFISRLIIRTTYLLNQCGILCSVYLYFHSKMAYKNYEILTNMFAQVSSGWFRSWWPSITVETETDTTTAAKEVRDKISCPYNYILSIYGSAHFTKIIRWLDPTLEEKDPSWFALILEIMDAIHFGAILVDDVADGSKLRKGRTAAHHIYGSSETINRAYLRIFELVEKCRATKPSAVPFILDNLTQIHKGQDPCCPLV